MVTAWFTFILPNNLKLIIIVQLHIVVRPSVLLVAMDLLAAKNAQ
jgi:hypothetical protein